MADDGTSLLRYTTEIVEAFLQSERLPPEQLPTVLRQVHSALARLGQGEPAAPEPEEQKPAVPVRRSVQEDRIVCLDCGATQKTLRRHLATAHGLTPEAYREKWGLPRDYPMVAPAYREQRSAMARRIGLGTKRRNTAPEPQPEPAPEPPPAPAKVRRPRRRAAGGEA